MPTLDTLNEALTGRYVTEREAGAGGMATVYLARDVKHNRRVALKVLKPELGIVLGVERFLSEIETTANLQHPHLLPLFDSGEIPLPHGPSLLFYVMPYVDGETLRQRIERERQLPVDEAVRIAVAVASALDYAHRHNVIHRDLKPENILLHEGEPLVTDFGIALAVSNAGGARITQTGLSLGTPQYMSPEQATGDRTIDARSDIYSLGAVLYEMLAGDPPHSAGTTQAIIAKVLTEKPPSVRTLRDTVPEHVDLAIQKALAKLAADRFASAGEFAEALTGQRPVVAATTGVRAPTAERAEVRPSRTARIATWGGWVVGALGIGVAAAVWFRPEVSPPTARFLMTFPDSVQLGVESSTTVLLSPDGSKLVFAGTRGSTSGLFLRRLDDPAPELIRGTEGAGTPTLSPDGNWVLFTHGGGLVKVPLTGGTALPVTDSAAGGSSWGDRNEIVFRDAAFSLWRVSADGGRRTLLARPDRARNHLRYNTPNVLPGGKAALITIAKGASGTAGAQLGFSELGLVTIPDGKVTELGLPGSYPRYLSAGYVLFGRPDGSLLAVPFSASRLRLTGAPVTVLGGVANFNNGVVAYAVSRNGTLAYIAATLAGKRPMLVVDRKGNARSFANEREDFSFPRFSPDGRRVAVAVGGGGGQDIWTYDIPSRTLTRLTQDGVSSRPDWTPDGRRIAFQARDSAGSLVRWQAWDGSGTAELMVRPKAGVAEVSLGPAHSYAAFRVVNGVGGVTDRDIWIAPLDSLDAARAFVATPSWEGHPRVSPNGRLLAYVSDESGRDEVYVRPLPGPGGRVQISSGGGREVVWSTDGRELFYRTPGFQSARYFMSATITERPELAVARRDTLFQDIYVSDPDHPDYDVLPGGRGFLMFGQERRESSLYVVVNWIEEFKRRVKAK